MATEPGFLDKVPAEAKALLLKRSRRRHFARKEVVFHQGDPADSLHVLDRGWLAVRVVTALGDVATLDLLGAGSLFGELALLPPTHGHRSATVVALEPSQTLEIPAAAFIELCSTSEAAVGVVLVLMAERERRLTERLMEALYLPVDARLVRRLMEVDRQYRQSRRETGAIPLTQDDLASLAGTTRESANRVLRHLAEAGAISVARGSFEVRDRSVLEHLARVGAGRLPVG